MKRWTRAEGQWYALQPVLFYFLITNSRNFYTLLISSFYVAGWRFIYYF